MAADRHIGFRKNGVIQERIDRFSRNLKYTSRGLPRNLHCGESKIATDRPISFIKMLYFRNILTDSHQIGHARRENSSCYLCHLKNRYV
jgi:hypothetical protein